MGRQKNLAVQIGDAAKLIIAATHAITDTVETMQCRIGGGPQLLNRPFEPIVKTFVTPSYKAIHGIVNVVGAGIDWFFPKLVPLVHQPSLQSGPLLAAINGVWGDNLSQAGSSLAIEMCLVHQDEVLQLNQQLHLAPKDRSERLVVFLHGSSTDESCWRRKGFDYGVDLQKICGLMPLYLRYNSGLHISENGQSLARLLQALIDHWPVEIKEIVMIGHSMGGLIARSACHYAERQHAKWRNRLSKLITLGSPHHGSPLERAGNWLENFIKVHPFSEPIGELGKIRSAGITDLRFGSIVDEDWQGRDRFSKENVDPRVFVPLPAGVQCFAVAATIGRDGRKSWLGDGLVPISSALGMHRDPCLSLNFPECGRVVIQGASHLDLLSHKTVRQLLTEWCQDLGVAS